MDAEKTGKKRLRSGIPRLDHILNGGFLHNGLYVLMGPPGSGKTILTTQLCFDSIKQHGYNCLYITLTTESQNKLINHLESMGFFDADEIGKRMFFVSGRNTLSSKGLESFMELCRSSISKYQAKVVVIDGLERLEMKVIDRPEAFLDFFHDFQSFCAVAGTTCFATRTTLGSGLIVPESTVADGVVEMHMREEGPRLVRELSVHKIRGTSQLPGRHEVEITERGVVVHPRTEVQFHDPENHPQEERVRMTMGLKELDHMLDGGLWSSSSTCLLGAPGTGKTLLGCFFLVEGARQGQKGIYFGFYEPPQRLMEKCEAVGLPLKKYVDNGMIEILWQPPLEKYMDSLAEQLLEKLRKERARNRRLFVDGYEGFRSAAVYRDRLPRFLSALTNQLRVMEITTLMSLELNLFEKEMHMPQPEFGSIMENVINLRFMELGGKVHRLLTIMKTRDSDYDSSIRNFIISSAGIRLERLSSDLESTLTGDARSALQPKQGKEIHGEH